VFSLRKDHAPSRIPLEHLRKSSGPVAIIGFVAVVVEYLDAVARQLQEACCGGGHVRRVQERPIDLQRHAR